MSTVGSAAQPAELDVGDAFGSFDFGTILRRADQNWGDDGKFDRLTEQAAAAATPAPM